MMKKRREFLFHCTGLATALLVPAKGLFSASWNLADGSAYGIEEFQSLLGKRTPLQEGGWVAVSHIDPLGPEVGCEQFTVQMFPESARATGVYTLDTEMGARPLYLEAGGSAHEPSLTACVGHVQA